MGFGRDVRAALFRRVQRFSLREVNEFGAPSLITRNTNDVQQVQMFVVMALMLMISAPITMVGGVIMALRENVQLSGLLLVIVPIMLLVIGLVMRGPIPLFRSVQVKIDGINQVLRENLTGIRVIRAFVRTQHEEERFAAANADLTATTLRVTRLFALTMPAMMLIINASSVAIVWFGAHLVDRRRDADRQHDGVPVLHHADPLRRDDGGDDVVMVPRAAASAERMQAVLGTDPAIAIRTTPVAAPAGRAPPESSRPGLVEFRDVEFRYPGAQEPVLHDVTLTFRPGATTAVVGSTGSGKTTLVNLIPRLYDVTGGAGAASTASTSASRSAGRCGRGWGWCPSARSCSAGPWPTNLRFGKEAATDDELWQRARRRPGAGVRRAARRRPRGAGSSRAGRTSPAGSGSGSRSPGRWCAGPAVYLFDDSFSALDYATDARLRAALRADTAGATVDRGRAADQHACWTPTRSSCSTTARVVGVGTHEELLAGCDTYAEIVAVPARRGGGGMSATRTRPARGRRAGGPAVMGRPDALRRPGPAAGAAARSAARHGHAGREGRGLPRPPRRRVLARLRPERCGSCWSSGWRW